MHRIQHIRTAARVLLVVQHDPVATMRQIAQAAECSTRTVARALRTLEQAGMLAPRTAPARTMAAREVRT